MPCVIKRLIFSALADENRLYTWHLKYLPPAAMRFQFDCFHLWVLPPIRYGNWSGRLPMLARMRFERFLQAWGKDWIALMSGFASLVLLFWAAIRPPSQDQLKHAIFFVSVVCFVFGSYRIWSAEHQRWLDLTGKTREEFFADAIAEFTKLERWYGSDECTRRGPLDHLIEKTLVEVRR